MSRREFVRLINPIIERNRDLGLGAAKVQRSLRSTEVLELLKKLGEPPKSFGRKKLIDTLEMNKRKLYNLVQPMSDQEFSQILTPILEKSRKKEGNQRFVRRLRTNEVVQFLETIGELSPESTVQS